MYCSKRLNKLFVIPQEAKGLHINLCLATGADVFAIRGAR